MVRRFVPPATSERERLSNDRKNYPPLAINSSASGLAAARVLSGVGIGSSELIAATPGAGKTIPALHVAHELLRRNEIERVVVVAPTRHLARQWAKEAHRCGLNLEPNLPGFVEPGDCHGIAITYQRVAAASAVYRHGCRRRTLTADGPHHLGEQLQLGGGVLRGV